MNLHFILGDQLNQKISCLEGFNPEKDMIFMCEVWEEATYVKHHKKKIAFIFSDIFADLFGVDPDDGVSAPSALGPFNLYSLYLCVPCIAAEPFVMCLIILLN